MKGAAGSVRSLALHPDASAHPLLASVSLDRFLRVHDTNTRASVCKVYCKQQLTGVVWLPPSVGAAAGWHADAEHDTAERTEAQEGVARTITDGEGAKAHDKKKKKRN